MEELKKFLKSFTALVLVCVLLVCGECVCELFLPAVTADIVNVGIRQWGLDDGLPEALSAQGLELLKCFMREEDARLTESIYNTLGSGTAEGKRLADKYPLLSDTAVCILREDAAPKDIKYGRLVYNKAVYALLLYLSGNAQTWVSTTTVGQPAVDFGEYLRDPLENDIDNNLPEGIVGTIPEGAIFSMPTPEPEPAPSNGEEDLFTEDEWDDEWDEEPEYDGENREEGVTGTGGYFTTVSESFGDEDKNEDAAPVSPDHELNEAREQLAAEYARGDVMSAMRQLETNKDLEDIYVLLPLLNRAGSGSTKGATAAAETVSEGVAARLGLRMKRRFYRELGYDVNGRRDKYIMGGLIKTAVLLLAAAAAALVSQRVCYILGNDHGVKGRRAALLFRIALYAALIVIPSAVLVINYRHIAGAVTVAVMLAAAGFYCFRHKLPALDNVFLLPDLMLEGYGQGLFKNTAGARVSVCFAPMMLAVIDFVSAAVVAGSSDIAGSGVRLGDKAAFYQYAALTLWGAMQGAYFLGGLLKREVSK